jgi:hypothetical protein
MFIVNSRLILNIVDRNRLMDAKIFIDSEIKNILLNHLPYKTYQENVSDKIEVKNLAEKANEYFPKRVHVRWMNLINLSILFDEIKLS